jgi:hypothetical protein
VVLEHTKVDDSPVLVFLFSCLCCLFVCLFGRHQTLAANIVCPGASTLLSNLLRSETLQFVAPTQHAENAKKTEATTRENEQKGSRRDFNTQLTAVPVLKTNGSRKKKFRRSSSGGEKASDSDSDSSDTSSATSIEMQESSALEVEAGEWSYEYQWGMSHEMYPLDFTSPFYGLKFSWIVTVLYQQ